MCISSGPQYESVDISCVGASDGILPEEGVELLCLQSALIFGSSSCFVWWPFLLVGALLSVFGFYRALVYFSGIEKSILIHIAKVDRGRRRYLAESESRTATTNFAVLA